MIFFSLLYLKVIDDSFRILHLYCLILQETIRYFAIWIILVFVLTSLLNVTKGGSHMRPRTNFVLALHGECLYSNTYKNAFICFEKTF